MTFLQSIILGILQGITEFLPISSSAHLVLFPYLLNWNIPEDQLFPFNVLVQMGTLAAVIYYYRADIWIIMKAMLKGIVNRQPFAEVEARTGWLTLLASVPAGAIGLLLKPLVQSAFSSPSVTAVFLFVTAGLLVASETIGKRTRSIGNLTWHDALWIGAFQLLAVFPGISRSGATITAGMTRNLKRKTAGQFSFLMSIPIMLAAGLIGLLDLQGITNLENFLPLMTVGFLTAAMVGYFSISWLISYINNHSLLPFAGYCLILGAGSLALSMFNPQGSLSVPIVSSTDTSTMTLKVGVEPNLEWLLPNLTACQKENSSFELDIVPYANSDETSSLFDLYLTYGPSLSTQVNTFHLGEDQLQVVVSRENPLQTITPALLKGIISGRIDTWYAADNLCNECFLSPFDSPESIILWKLPEDEYLWRRFVESISPGPVSSFAKVAPHAGLMRSMVAGDLNAIGVSPAGWLDDSLKGVPLADELGQPFLIPITASSSGKLDKNTEAWLLCVQSAIEP